MYMLPTHFYLSKIGGQVFPTFNNSKCGRATGPTVPTLLCVYVHVYAEHEIRTEKYMSAQDKICSDIY